MNFIINEKIKKENLAKVIEAYYRFYEKMFGSRRIPFGKPVEFTKNPITIRDLYDGNLTDAIYTVYEIDNDLEFFSLSGYDENDNLSVLVRFKKILYSFDNDTIHHESAVSNNLYISDIVFTKYFNDIEKESIYLEILKYIEENLLLESDSILSIEIPKHDDILYFSALSLGYHYDETKIKQDRHYRTIIVDKFLNLEKGENFGRNRISK